MAIDVSKYVVSKEEFQQRTQQAFTESDEFVITQTPDEETRIIEQLLGVSQGGFNPSQTKRDKGKEDCPNCGRRFTLLDVVNTGVGLHGKTFLKDILTGNQGFLCNVGTVQKLNCYNCGGAAASGMGCYQSSGGGGGYSAWYTC